MPLAQPFKGENMKLSAPAFAVAPALRKASGGGASRRQAQGGASGKCRYDYRVGFGRLAPRKPSPSGRGSFTPLRESVTALLAYPAKTGQARRGIQPTCP